MNIHQVLDQLSDIFHRVNVHAAHDRGFLGVDRRKKNLDKIFLLGQQDKRQSSVGVPQRSVKGEFSEHQAFIKIRSDLAGRDQYSQSYGYIVGRTLLGEIGRSKVDRNSSVGTFGAGVVDR